MDIIHANQKDRRNLFDGDWDEYESTSRLAKVERVVNLWDHHRASRFLSGHLLAFFLSKTGEMKNNIDYFTHDVDSHQHPKFKMLRLEYGREWEWRFRALNGIIAQAENCTLDLSQKYNKASIATDLWLSLQGLDEFVAFLLSEDCRLLKRVEWWVTTDRVQEILSKLSAKRKRNQTYYRQLSDDSQTTENKIQPAESIQSKVKESKVKESKENNFSHLRDLWKNSVAEYKLATWNKATPWNREKAKQSYTKSNATLEQVQSAILSYFEEKTTNKEFVQHFSTWLNQKWYEQEWWDDEPTVYTQDHVTRFYQNKLGETYKTIPDPQLPDVYPWGQLCKTEDHRRSYISRLNHTKRIERNKDRDKLKNLYNANPLTYCDE